MERIFLIIERDVVQDINHTLMEMLSLVKVNALTGYYQTNLSIRNKVVSNLRDKYYHVLDLPADENDGCRPQDIYSCQ